MLHTCEANTRHAEVERDESVRNGGGSKVGTHLPFEDEDGVFVAVLLLQQLHNTNTNETIHGRQQRVRTYPDPVVEDGGIDCGSGVAQQEAAGGLTRTGTRTGTGSLRGSHSRALLLAAVGSLGFRLR